MFLSYSSCSVLRTLECTLEDDSLGDQTQSKTVGRKVRGVRSWKGQRRAPSLSPVNANTTEKGFHGPLSSDPDSPRVALYVTSLPLKSVLSIYGTCFTGVTEGPSGLLVFPGCLGTLGCKVPSQPVFPRIAFPVSSPFGLPSRTVVHLPPRILSETQINPKVSKWGHP